MLQPATWFSPGQVVGPQAPGQAVDGALPYDNFKLDKNKPESIKHGSGHLRFPLKQVRACYTPRFGFRFCDSCTFAGRC